MFLSRTLQDWIKLNKMVFLSPTHLLFLYLIYYLSNMFRLAIVIIRPLHKNTDP